MGYVLIGGLEVLQPLCERGPASSHGNTLIAETSYGRITEVTRENEIVWEYVSPYSTSEKVHSARMFRAYRVPTNGFRSFQARGEGGHPPRTRISK
jgi:hypothetical protein